MSEQQSQKHGLRSEGQKMERARDGYDANPRANPVAGAFGDRESDSITDQDLALQQNTKGAKTENQEPS